MRASFGDVLGQFEVEEAVSAGDLTIFGLRRLETNGLTYVTMDEAIAAGTLQVTEVSEGGSVPDLKVVNQGDQMVFLMAGEQLVGGKQNRILNVSMMVQKKSEAAVPVTCVERGRWGYQSHRFRSSGSSSHSALRYKMMRVAHESYRKRQRPDSDQHAVWEEVDRKLMEMGSKSPSAALEQAYADNKKRLKETLQKIKVGGKCAGAVFAFGGRIVGMDLFDNAGTFSKLLPKISRSYALDAISAPDCEWTVCREDVVVWLSNASDVAAESFDSPGVGIDLRYEREQLSGASLLVEDQPVHVELFEDMPLEP